MDRRRMKFVLLGVGVLASMAFLLLVGVKLLLEDFPNGQPATLFVALALVGGALLLVAKLLDRGTIEELEISNKSRY